MILIYCKKTTPRIEYIFNHFLNLIFKKKFSITNSKSNFLDFSGYKFSYGNVPISKELFFQSNGLLDEKGLENHEIKTFEWEGVKCFFKVSSKSALPFDVFSASFFLLSRYEEYIPHTGNKFSQFNYLESVAYREEFLEIPLIDIWIEKFKSILETRMKLKFTKNSKNLKPSIIINSICLLYTSDAADEL